MSTHHFILESSNTSEFNDQVFSGSPFPIVGNYSLVIRPVQTRFWRFGLRFSTTSIINFSTSNGRHNNPLTPDIHLAVGEWNRHDWSQPNQLELDQYHIPGYEHVLARSDNYNGQRVQLDLNVTREDEIYNRLFISVHHTGGRLEPISVKLHRDLQFFAPFAWADGANFKIEISIDGQNVLAFGEPATVFDEDVIPDSYLFNILNIGESKPEITGKWIVKFNPFAANIDETHVGDRIKFQANKLRFVDGSRDVNLFRLLSIDDTVYGYAKEPFNGIIFVFTVTKTLHSDPAKGEIVELEVTRTIPSPFRQEEITKYVRRTITSFLQDKETPISLMPLTREESEFLENVMAIPSTKAFFRPSFNPEGDHAQTADQLDFENDIDALASLIAFKGIDPPLAIGLFGNWGSGKSFFMHKLHDRVQQKAGHPFNVHHIVQARFNAWHYHDANLWASLMAEIFDSLHQYANQDQKKEQDIASILGTLEITRAQKQQLAAEEALLQKEVDNIQKKREDERRSLQDMSGIALVASLLGDNKIREDFKALNNPNIEQVVQNGEQIQKWLEESKSTSTQVASFFKQVGQLRGLRWTLVCVGTIILFLLAFSLRTIFHEEWAYWSMQLAVGSSFVLSLIKNIRELLQPYKETFEEVQKRLNSLISTIAKRRGEQQIPFSPEELRLVEVTTRIEHLDTELKIAEEKVKSIVSGKALWHFINQQHASGTYSKQLGIVSMIRKDFDTLNRLLSSQKTAADIQSINKNDEQRIDLQIDRMILYIDDLDRCDEHIVLKVLEAIHLILAFPIFVVVVGVDPRWLNNAVNQKLGKLLRSADHHKTKSIHAEPAATSYDYLEKIFQIPFAIKPVTPSNRETLVKYLLQRNQKEQQENTSPQLPPQRNQTVNEQQTEIHEQMPAQVTLADSIKTTPPQELRPLTFSSEEIKFIQRVSVLFGYSPRTINRFVNLYRIVRTHRNWHAPEKFSSTHQATLLTLAIIVGHPEETREFIALLRSAYPDSTPFSTFITNHSELAWLNQALKEPGTEIISDQTLTAITVSDFKKHLDFLTRFSFRTIL